MHGFLRLFIQLALLCISLGQRSPTHTVVGYCRELTSTNQLQFDFRLSLNDDPVGTTDALDFNGDIVESGCTISFNSAEGLYYVTSVINLSNRQPASNGCGFSVDATNLLYSWSFKYYELANFKNVSVGLNRVYTAVCNLSAIQDDQIEALISVSFLNLNQTVTIEEPDISLHILYEESPDNYVKVTDSTPAIVVDTNIKLQLELAFGTFDPSQFYGIGGLRVDVDSSTDFSSPIEIFNTSGCPSNLLYAPDTPYGFLGPTSDNATSPYVSMTDPFPIWLFADSNIVAFKVYFDLCRDATFNGEDFCKDPCNNPRSSRRRRDVNEERAAIVSVRVVDRTNKGGNLQSTSDDSMLYIGVGVAGALFLVLLAVVACLVLFRARGHLSREKSSRAPPDGFVNQVQY